MATYSILSFSPDSVWLRAMDLGFAHLARINPGWTYSLTTEQDNNPVPNLYILDLTNATEACVESFPVKNSRMLVLLRASQRRLIRKLHEESRCSVLCVDEYFFNYRDIVEASVRNKRFLSPYIRELTTMQPKSESTIELTAAESKVLTYIRDGLNGVEISEALFRSQKTVSSHKRNIMRKLGVRDDLGLKQKIQAMAECEL
ncbi:helix-turn-helix domain-containing protein [Enterobacteriaceae bacterium C23F]